MNIIELAGYLGADAEERYTPNGQKLVVLRLATKARRAGKDETIWWRVVIWGDRFDKLIPYLKKGRPIIVLGELSKPTLYTDREGKSQVSLEVTAEIIRFSPFGMKNDSKESNSGSEYTDHSSEESMASFGIQDTSGSFETDDDVPF